MNKKRHFLEPPEVKEYLLKGERLTKWSEVSVSFQIYYFPLQGMYSPNGNMWPQSINTHV